MPVTFPNTVWTLSIFHAPLDFWNPSRVSLLSLSLCWILWHQCLDWRRIQCLAEISQEVVPKRIKEMEAAIAKRDFPSFARLACADSNQFHAVCLDTLPPIFYMNDTSHRQAPFFSSNQHHIIFSNNWAFFFVNHHFEAHRGINISGLSAVLRNGIVMKEHLRLISFSLHLEWIGEVFSTCMSEQFRQFLPLSLDVSLFVHLHKLIRNQDSRNATPYPQMDCLNAHFLLISCHSTRSSYFKIDFS